MQQQSLPQRFSTRISEISAASETYVPQLVDAILAESRLHRASDIHLVPHQHSLQMQWRIDGVLHTISSFDGDLAVRIVARLKVMAGLLSYRTDIPQEGRISRQDAVGAGEVRVTTFPTLFGEKAAVRLFADAGHFRQLDDLVLPADIATSLRELLQATSGVILLTGPSGSGKTTTVYACLRELVAQNESRRGIMTLEDPIEVVIPGVTQSQVRPSVGFDLATGLKSMMRQDPDVIMIGEIRDPQTAEAAFQAALTGHLVITTFHAGSSCEAITRLLDLGIEPYLIRSTLRAVVCQRLLRRSCADCSDRSEGNTTSQNSPAAADSSDKTTVAKFQPESCPTCSGLRFHNRFVTAELLDPNQQEIARAIMKRSDATVLDRIANETGTVTLLERAHQTVEEGLTTAEEVFRVFGSKPYVSNS